MIPSTFMRTTRILEPFRDDQRTTRGVRDLEFNTVSVLVDGGVGFGLDGGRAGRGVVEDKGSIQVGHCVL